MNQANQMNLALERAYQQLDASEIDKLKAQNAANLSNLGTEKKDPNLIIYQLELENEELRYILSGYTRKEQEDHSIKWMPPDNDAEKILSDFGVNEILRIYFKYARKGTILSIVTEELIIQKMNSFAHALNRLLFNRAEDIFYAPSPEKLYNDYWPLVQKLGMDITKIELYDKCIIWSKEELQKRYRHQEMILKSICDNVEFTLRRALHGETLKLIMKQYNIHETINPSIAPQINRPGLFRK